MTRVRWWVTADDAFGAHWSEWHTTDTTDTHCAACCCGGPHDGEHQEQAPTYNLDGYLEWSTHTRLDPTDPDPWVTVEWQPPTDTT